MSEISLASTENGDARGPRRATREREGPPVALFPQLKARPGIPREVVRASQRRRLHAAMVEAVAEGGYAATTTRRLRALAGVSERTVYEHFASKEDYFLDTYDEVIRDGVERIAAAYRAQAPREPEWTSGLCRAFDAFAVEVVERPKASRLALVEVLAVGAAALERVEVGEELFEQMIAQSLAQAPEPVALPPVLLKAIVGGIWCVARQRLLEGVPETISECGRELLDWLLSYPSLAIAALGEVAIEPPSAAVQSPPTGEERLRATRAAAEVAADDGYEALSVARICEEADVRPERFFELFEGHEECFLAGLELLSAQALARALRESEGAPDWPAGVCRAVRAMLREVAENRVFARAAFIESFGAGRAGVERRARLVRSFATVLARRAPRRSRPSPLVAEAIIGAGWGIARHHVAHDRAAELPALSGYVSYLVLAPALGAGTAIEAIRAELGPEASADGGSRAKGDGASDASPRSARRSPVQSPAEPLTAC